MSSGATFFDTEVFSSSAISNLPQLTESVVRGNSPGPVRRAQGTVGGHHDAFGVAVLDELLLGEVRVALDLQAQTGGCCSPGHRQ